ncbi:MAG TPA: hypothetical protein VLB44_04215 [Kofleriaceae bacterium]|nr:hypothetical protein [Kofleriaceae bacterium]
MEATTMRKLMFAVVAMTAAVAQPAMAEDDLGLLDVRADVGKPMAEWTPVQQWMPRYDGRDGDWVRNWIYAAVMADSLGDKLSQLGRATLLDHCMEAMSAQSHVVMWALCGEDAKAIDIKKIEAELHAEHMGPDTTQRVLDKVKRDIENATKIGAEVEAAAKDDPGVAQVLALPAKAKAEWQKYLSKNQDAFARYLRLMDAVRSGKSNNKGYDGCWDATQPAFAKLVKETKFDYDAEQDLVNTYVATMFTSTENYITVASFAACAYGQHESGGAIADAALNSLHAGTMRVGWRTTFMAMVKDPKVKPKFADRSINWTEHGALFHFYDDTYSNGGAPGFRAMTTPNHGVVSKIKKDGDMLVVSFKGDQVETCLHWVETRKVTGYAANGDPTYQRVCKKRGMVDNQEGDTPVFSKFAAGIAPGTGVITVDGYPACTYKNKKFVSVLGFPNSK